MKIQNMKAWLAAALLMVAGGADAQHAPRLLGGDLSMLPVYEEAEVVYRDYGGKPVELLPWLKSQGWNTVRVRLFVNPENASDQHKGEGVCQDLDYVLRFARQIKAAGLQWMLDFHYSDTWADPGKQFIPKAWEGLVADVMADSVYQHTRQTLVTLRKAGVAPRYIQVGNEITNGMLWPTAKVNPYKDANWQVLAQMVRSGVKACREVCPDAQLIIHTEKAGDTKATCLYYERLKQLDVDYDVIGLSYYPMWHGTIPHLGHTLDSLTTLFPEKPIMIVEAAAYYSHENDPWAKDPNQFAEFFPISVQGQLMFTRQLVQLLNRHPQVMGLFWWFPEENGCDNEVCPGWLNRGLFDNHSGKALPAMRELRRFVQRGR